MNIQVSFTKPIPDELYINSFQDNKTKTWTYNGKNILYVSVSKILGKIENVHDSLEFNYNPDITEVFLIDAAVNPDVAYYVAHTDIPDRIFETETLVDGSTYEQITNPTLQDIYQLTYDFENSRWNWEIVTRNPKTNLNILAEKNRQYINDNIETISDNPTLLATANTYLQTLDTFETTGKGSIPSWKMITTNLADVPSIPQELIIAFNVLP